MKKVSVATKPGEEFLGKQKVVSWPRILAFSGGQFTSVDWPKKNIHTDLDFAKSCGLPTMAVSATQFEAHAVELMVDLFGTNWLAYGSIDVKFVNIAEAEDILQTKATVTSIEPDDKTVKFNIALSTENQKGIKVQVGSAIGYISEINPSRLRPEKPKFEGEIHTYVEPHLLPLEFVVTPELNQQYLFAVEDYNPRYLEAATAGSPITHPGLLLNMSNATRSPSFNLPAGRAGFHARDEAFFTNPAQVGDKLIVSWTTLGTYEKRGRPYIVRETVITNQDGIEILRRFKHSTIVSSV